MANLAICLIMLILSIVDKVQAAGRLLRFMNSSDQLISDGLHHHVENEPPFIHLYGSSSSSSSSSTDVCVHLYGFFPCADNIAGYILLIFVYQYFMNVGEHLLTKGSTEIFHILGPGIYGASAFRILKALPGLALMIVSGIFATKEDAQSQVSLGVSVYAGSTIFSLTLMWGVRVIVDRKKMPEAPSSSQSSLSEDLLPKKNILKSLNDTGVTTDIWTRGTAGIMLLSLIPFLIVQLGVTALGSSFRIRLVILIALLVSITLLLAYFIYQFVVPSIQERSLECSMYENLVEGFFHASSQFEKVGMDKQSAISETLRAFDSNNDKVIDKAEFIEGFSKLIHDAKKLPLAENGDARAGKVWQKVIKSFEKKKEDEITKIERLTERSSKDVQSQAPEAEGLLNDNGSSNEERIKGVFNMFDKDQNNLVSPSEPEQLIGEIKFGEMQQNHDDIESKVTTENGMIDEEEFVRGMRQWLDGVTRLDKRRSINDFDEVMWEKIDKLAEVVKHGGRVVIDKLTTWAINKSAFHVCLGIAMLTFLSRPLIMNILQLSNALQIQSWLISFVIVPFAMNARRAMSAFFIPARPNINEKTGSLTFSEIYGGVIMNNITGLVTLLAIVYAKDLTWDYSAEVLIILLICAVVGTFSSLRTTYPVWTSFVAFFLYPVSVVLFYVLQHI